MGWKARRTLKKIGGWKEYDTNIFSEKKIIKTLNKKVGIVIYILKWPLLVF